MNIHIARLGVSDVPKLVSVMECMPQQGALFGFAFFCDWAWFCGIRGASAPQSEAHATKDREKAQFKPCCGLRSDITEPRFVAMSGRILGSVEHRETANVMVHLRL